MPGEPSPRQHARAREPARAARTTSSNDSRPDARSPAVVQHAQRCGVSNRARQRVRRRAGALYGQRVARCPASNTRPAASSARTATPSTNADVDVPSARRSSSPSGNAAVDLVATAPLPQQHSNEHRSAQQRRAAEGDPATSPARQSDSASVNRSAVTARRRLPDPRGKRRVIISRHSGVPCRVVEMRHRRRPAVPAPAAAGRARSGQSTDSAESATAIERSPPFRAAAARPPRGARRATNASARSMCSTYRVTSGPAAAARRAARTTPYAALGSRATHACPRADGRRPERQQHVRTRRPGRRFDERCPRSAAIADAKPPISSSVRSARSSRARRTICRYMSTAIGHEAAAACVGRGSPADRPRPAPRCAHRRRSIAAHHRARGRALQRFPTSGSCRNGHAGSWESIPISQGVEGDLVSGDKVTAASAIEHHVAVVQQSSHGRAHCNDLRMRKHSEIRAEARRSAQFLRYRIELEC